MIDNYDSFTYNIVQYLGELGADVEVFRNDEITCDEIKKLKPGKGQEIHITDAIRSLIKKNSKFIAHKFKGKYLDCGTMSGYINSSKEIAKL